MGKVLAVKITGRHQLLKYIRCMPEAFALKPCSLQLFQKPMFLFVFAIGKVLPKCRKSVIRQLGKLDEVKLKNKCRLIIRQSAFWQ